MDPIAPVTPLPSASILLIRDGLRGLEVMMMKRAETMRFAPGVYVFPGGKVDEGDHRSYFWRKYISPEAQFDDLALRIAVLRELYEEAGILYTEGQCTRHIGARSSLSSALAYAQDYLAVEQLIPFSHWITPIQAGRRFDTLFYLAPLYREEEGVEDGSEMIAKRWVRPKELLKNWRKGDIPIMFPTRLNLERLSKASSVAEALKQAPHHPVMPILPEYKLCNEAEPKLFIPAEAGFGITEATAQDIAAEAKIMTRMKATRQAQQITRKQLHRDE
ncbi:NUDIX domain-containing protein [Temperatibacter marinus]|uniref:NUDIX domain-containing protein n=1 Tax=Temperatibacter marinus TaxID=1456591 RepID=A0AA52H9D7_9PROT|nr:NUDIX domain-containing protein [Temperatibacter marinus]WND02392.1 NUDIX domain-containing protein [Temperatibacter marinus]